ncbi:MAG TPA: hypothetical protein VJ698_15300 [Noviherbaspirillum sp.]|uniref:hypothetical protein n=1 Tax=Noviherbaspirillum sp. TaxID=1926288 RepID=UPI002B464B1B|nr:hypothetical protein [Noviherbaspirillum sp.]HJV86830.1 hypothetical protein [Noviherbaspirillum sp.]
MSAFGHPEFNSDHPVYFHRLFFAFIVMMLPATLPARDANIDRVFAPAPDTENSVRKSQTEYLESRLRSSKNNQEVLPRIEYKVNILVFLKLRVRFMQDRVGKAAAVLHALFWKYGDRATVRGFNTEQVRYNAARFRGLTRQH